MVDEKMLRISIAELKQLIKNEDENVEVHWISTNEMLSDCLTKTGASTDKLCIALENGFIDLKKLMEEEKRHASK